MGIPKRFYFNVFNVLVFNVTSTVRSKTSKHLSKNVMK